MKPAQWWNLRRFSGDAFGAKTARCLRGLAFEAEALRDRGVSPGSVPS